MQIIGNNLENVKSCLQRLNNKNARQIYEKMFFLLMQDFSIVQQKAEDLIDLAYCQIYKNCSTWVCRGLRQIRTNFFLSCKQNTVKKKYIIARQCK